MNFFTPGGDGFGPSPSFLFPLSALTFGTFSCKINLYIYDHFGIVRETPMPTVKPQYDNTSISSLKGADRVRKRPGVIFGSDGLDGCEHAVFEILSNAIDEA